MSTSSFTAPCTCLTDNFHTCMAHHRVLSRGKYSFTPLLSDEDVKRIAKHVVELQRGAK